MQELRDSLDKQKLQAAQNAKIVERFKPTEMTDKIKEMMKREDDNEKKLKMLKLVKVDVSSPEAIQQIKGESSKLGKELRSMEKSRMIKENGVIYISEASKLTTLVLHPQQIGCTGRNTATTSKMRVVNWRTT